MEKEQVRWWQREEGDGSPRFSMKPKGWGTRQQQKRNAGLSTPRLTMRPWAASVEMTLL